MPIPFRMLYLSILGFSLLPISNALWVPETLDSAPNVTTPTNVLGPVSQLHVVNEFIAPDGYNRS